jgi:hypothetical protein
MFFSGAIIAIAPVPDDSPVSFTWRFRLFRAGPHDGVAPARWYPQGFFA